jgi:hypothetical protein
VGDIYAGGVGCLCCGTPPAPVLCADCMACSLLTGHNYFLRLDRIRWPLSSSDPSDCPAIDWSPAICMPFVCFSNLGTTSLLAGDSISPPDPGDGTYTVGGKTITLSVDGGSISCQPGGLVELRAYLSVTVGGCSMDSITLPDDTAPIFLADLDNCNLNSFLGSYEVEFLTSPDNLSMIVDYTLGDAPC